MYWRSRNIWILRKQHSNASTTRFFDAQFSLSYRRAKNSYPLLYNTSGQQERCPESSEGLQFFPRLLTPYEILVMSWMEVGDKIKEIRLSEVGIYTEILNRILKQTKKINCGFWWNLPWKLYWLLFYYY